MPNETQGVQDFYKGVLADELVAAVKAAKNPNTGRGVCTYMQENTFYSPGPQFRTMCV